MGHAMVIIGYDDNMYGGAFEILNSWGEEWGDNGYIWIRESDLIKYSLAYWAIHCEIDYGLGPKSKQKIKIPENTNGDGYLPTEYPTDSLDNFLRLGKILEAIKQN